jgi:hypothetical protein
METHLNLNSKTGENIQCQISLLLISEIRVNIYFSFNFSTADSWVRSRIVSGREGGGGSLRGSGLNQTNSKFWI